MKKKLVKNTKTSNQSSKKDQYTVVLEDLRSRFKVFGEGLMDVHRKLDQHSEILGDHSKVLGNHSRVLNDHSKTLSSHTEMIGQILTDLAEIKNDMKQKVDRQEFARLEKRVIMLERRSR